MKKSAHLNIPNPKLTPALTNDIEWNTSTERYGPSLQAPTFSPLFLPINPRKGWEQADRPRRIFATMPILLAVIWAVVIYVPSGSAGAIYLMLIGLIIVIGPPACYSLARVVRPHTQGTKIHRKIRHWCASIATAYGGSTLFALQSPQSFENHSEVSKIIIAFIIIGSTLGPITLLWGVGSLLHRAFVPQGETTINL